VSSKLRRRASKRESRERCNGRLAAAAERQRLLRLARRAAAEFAIENAWRLCSADDVYRELLRRRHDLGILGNVLGSIFRTREWVRTPIRVWSERPGGKRREIRVYRYIGEECRRGPGRGIGDFALSWDW
jgi:hypothetical protein